MTWESFDTFYGAHWLATGYSCRGFVQDFPALGGGDAITEFVGIMDQSNNSVVFHPSDFDRTATFTAHRLVHDDNWRAMRTAEFYRSAQRFFRFGDRLRTIDLKRATTEELAAWVERILPLHRTVRLLGVLLNGVIIDGRNHLSNLVQEELRSLIRTDDFATVWSHLSQPTKPSYAQRKDQALFLLRQRLI